MLRLYSLLVCLIAGALFTQPSVRAQESEPRLEFFSGNVSELPEGKIVVSRSLLGKEGEKRTFRMTADTKVEGKLKLKARVTVGFTNSDDGEVALQIIVRDKDNRKKQ